MPRRARRDLLGALAAGGLGIAGARASPVFDPVLPQRALVFPRDFGMHPGFRTEWWYLTGWLQAPRREIGFQVTFFRSRTLHDPRNPSRFAPTQLLLAHAAIAEDGAARLRHDQRAARAGFDLASASATDTALAIGTGWRMTRGTDDRYRVQVEAQDFTLELRATPPGPPVLQGLNGFSRKGPKPTQASYYYSRPGLAIEGRLTLAAPGATPGRSAATRPEGLPVRGTGWLDHEWSSELLDPEATGWDWVGLNLDDGSALMAFRLRRRDGSTLWSDARWVGAGAPVGKPTFIPLRIWRSPRSGADWPVAMRLEVGGRTLELRPIFDDQELDTRSSTGTIYWEGAVRVFERSRQIGRGYLELTGYAGALRL